MIGSAKTKAREKKLEKAQLSADQLFELEKLRLEAKNPKVTLGKIAAENAAFVDTTDSEGRAKLLSALPWVLGGAAVIGVFMLLRGRAKGRS